MTEAPQLTQPTVKPALFGTVLVANRGEIACRVIRTLRALGIRSVAVYSDADADARHVREADAAIRIGPAAAAESYLKIEAIIRACLETGAQAVHPGYGFLSENVGFARALEAAGITFIGPGVESLNVMGDKIRSKNHVAGYGVPVVPGIAEPGMTDAELVEAADAVGFPLLIKPSAGGGGKGMHIVERPLDLAATLVTARRVASSAFGDDTLFLERLIRTPRHIEVQVLADNHGNVIHLGERECSLQRRHQKVIEEAPSPLLESLPDGDAVRERIGEAACQAARSVHYSGAGTVEFLVSDDAPDEFFFMEMNTRLQVEHPVTEMVTGVDLVEWQVRIAAGEVLTVAQADVELTGHAVEARVYAETPEKNFLPATGTVLLLDEKPTGEAGKRVRVDSALLQGLEISSNYDPMVSKVIAWGEDRKAAIQTLNEALADYTLLGVDTNVEYLRLLMNDHDVYAGRLDTGLIERKMPGFTFRHVDDAELAAAAVYIWAFTQAVSGSERDRNSAWGKTDGWRLGRQAPWRVTMKTPSGELASVQITGIRPSASVLVRVNDGPERTASLAALADARLQLTLDGDASIYAMVPGSGPGEPQSTSSGRARSWETSSALPGEMFLGNGGWGCRLEILSRESRLAYVLAAIERDEGRADPQVRAPMPGTVVSVAVSNGAIVAEGQLLLAVEAMKMEHQLLAPLAGTVHLTIRTGDLVKAEEVVATIHPHDSVPAEDQPSHLPANQTQRTDSNNEMEQHHG